MDDQAINSNSTQSDDEFQATSQDKAFIDDDSNSPPIDFTKIEEEHRRNLKRIGKNLDEFSDCLSFEYTDMNSLKAFINLL